MYVYLSACTLLYHVDLWTFRENIINNIIFKKQNDTPPT